MPRRALTLLVAGVAVIAAAVAVAVLPVPYVILSPGPTLNTLGPAPGGQPLIDIKGHLVNHTVGHLNLVTVDYEGGPGDEINIFTALRAWLDPHNAVVPQQEVFGTGQSAQQVLKQDVQEMASSQETATAAAFTYLKIPFKTLIQVASTEPGMPAAGVLKAGDVIADVNGAPIDSLTALSAQIRGKSAGSPLKLTVIRKGKTIPLVVKSIQSQGHAEIGVVVVDQYKFPFDVTINVGNIGGPSAGMMFALGIIDKLGSVNLTGGRFIAGTGEITQGGAVQPIGGIQQKMAGARAQGATVFLAPAGNCSDALSAVPAGMRLVKVSTLSGAVSALAALRAGRPVPAC
ncbi:MAG: YlbL family protein [Streptosporangiaceae bacterium]